MDELHYYVVLIVFLTISKHTEQYTRWNIMFLLLHRSIGVPIQSVFISSICTLITFQHAATDGTKKRLMETRNLVCPSVFLLADFVVHVCPAIVAWAFMCPQNGPRKLIGPLHVTNVYIWLGTYYALVSGGFNCEKQYVPYPWRRQVYAVAIVPSAVWAAWNRDVQINSWWNSIALAIAVFYIREWYDIKDSFVRDTVKENCSPQETTTAF